MSDLPTRWQFMAHTRQLGEAVKKRAVHDHIIARLAQPPMKPSASGALYDAMTLPEDELIARFGKGTRR